MSETEYKKLQGSSSLTKRTRVWLGKDHVLSVQNLGYSEEYRRFYFRDIQAIIVQKTSLSAIFNWILGLVLIAPLLGVFAGLMALMKRPFQSDDLVLFIPLCLFGAILLVSLVMNIARGATCACYIKTAVQTERLPALNRIRTAQKFIETIMPLIAEAQGAITLEEIQNQTAGETVAEYQAPPIATHFAPVIPPTPQQCRGRIHLALYCLLLAEAFVGGIDFFYTHPVRDAVAMILSLATFIVLIIALVSQHGTGLWGRLKVMTWVALAYEILSFGVAFTVGIVLGIEHPERATEFGSMSPLENPIIFWLCVATTSIALLLGSFGIMFLRRYWRELAQPVTAPPPTVTTT